VVGVAANVPTTSLEKEAPLLVYAPFWIDGSSRGTLVVRTRGTRGSGSDPSSIAAAARAAARRVDPAVPVPRVRTMSEVVSASVAHRRFQLVVLGLFAATALATACVGIYGVVAHSLAQRDREMAVRMALGARPADIRRLVLGEGMRPVALGLAAGLALALLAGGPLRALLFEVRAGDPMVLAPVAALLAVVAGLACWVPARRAARAAPAEVLRLG
jgi:predicted lysophospholipase L1 biosynthesis ABC-type transport system permease subunit